MRKLILPVFGGLLYIALASNNSGSAYSGPNDCTGAEGTGSLATGGNAAVGCSTGSNCHNSSTSLGTTIQLLDQGNNLKTSYVPGASYTVKISATNNTSQTNLAKFGFQLASVTATGAGTASAVQGGTWGTSLPTNVQMTDTGSCTTCSAGLAIPIIEQHTALVATSGTGGIGTVYSISIPWIAPARGTGSIKLYGSLNACVGRDNVTQGYYQAASPITITEGYGAGINDISAMLTGLNVYPTLVNDNMTVAFDLVEANKVSVSIISIQGQTIKTLIDGESINGGAFNRSFSVSELPTGIYLVRVQVGNAYAVSKVVKG